MPCWLDQQQACSLSWLYHRPTFNRGNGNRYLFHISFPFHQLVNLALLVLGQLVMEPPSTHSPVPQQRALRSLKHWVVQAPRLVILNPGCPSEWPLGVFKARMPDFTHTDLPRIGLRCGWNLLVSKAPQGTSMCSQGLRTLFLGWAGWVMRRLGKETWTSPLYWVTKTCCTLLGLSRYV